LISKHYIFFAFRQLVSSLVNSGQFPYPIRIKFSPLDANRSWNGKGVWYLFSSSNTRPSLPWSYGSWI